MTTVLSPPSPTVRAPDASVRISFRQPVALSGFVDAAWWPRSLDLTRELPLLLDVLWTAGREITRVSYNLSTWEPAPRRLRVLGRTVRLGGFHNIDPLEVALIDSWGTDRIDVLVIAPDTSAEIAERALRLAGVADNPDRAGQIMDHAEHPDTVSLDQPVLSSA